MAPPTKDGLLKGYASLCKVLTFMLHMLVWSQISSLNFSCQECALPSREASFKFHLTTTTIQLLFSFSEGNALGKVSQLLLRICMWNDVLSKLGMTSTSERSLQLHSVRADKELDLRREDQTETLLRCFDFWILSTYQKKFSFMIG